MIADARYGVRQLGRSPAFTAAAVLTLALAIGATATIVAVADAVFLRPLPYPHADRLVVIHDELSKIGVQLAGVSYETYQAYRNVPAFDATSTFTEDERNLIGSGTSFGAVVDARSVRNARRAQNIRTRFQRSGLEAGTRSGCHPQLLTVR